MLERDVLVAVRDVAAEQAGFVTAAQAARVGVAAGMLDRLRRRGLMRRVRRGVYVFETATLHPEEDLVAAWLGVDARPLPWERRAGVPVAVVSHASAAALLGLGTVVRSLPDLTQAGRSSRQDGVGFHVAPLEEADWAWRDVAGVLVPVTTPARTIVDLVIGHEDGDYLARAVRGAFAGREQARVALGDAVGRRKERHGRLGVAVARVVERAFAEAP